MRNLENCIHRHLETETAGNIVVRVGHCGHTGQSVFADPQSGLYVIILSDATISTHKKYGKENYSEVMQTRHDIHAAIKKDLMQ